MPRRTPENRLEDLLESATRVFIAQGYRRTQMADVARDMGVAKGTLYLYVESKEALFTAVLRNADSAAPLPRSLDLPLRAPRPGALVRGLRDALAREVTPPALAQALSRKRVGDVRAELEVIVRELYALSSRHRTSTKLIDRCGADHPELAETFYAGGRYTQLEMLVRYLESRVRSGKLTPVRDPALAARFIIEAIATWAVHLHWDPAPQPIDPEDAEETVVQLIVSAFAGL